MRAAARLREYEAKRDFESTPEPPPRRPRRKKAGTRIFVVQKHAASQLHYDFRLELEGVLKSWSLPKGPSLDPGERRLAMQTEDHPLQYADFEGVIPKGQYGGGTVIVWDRGTWRPLDDDPHKAYWSGRMRFELRGKKLRGVFRLVRDAKSSRSWVLVKEEDAHAKRGAKKSVVDARPKSVATGRTLEQVAKDRDRVWQSNRAAAPSYEPELPVPASEPPRGKEWLHELLLGGERVLATVARGKATLKNADGDDVTREYAGVARALTKLGGDAVLDGEIVAAGDDGASVYVVYDLLARGGESLVREPLERRKELLRGIVDALGSPSVRFSEHVAGDPRPLVQAACARGVAGIVSKRRDSPYEPGRHDAWRVSACTSPRASNDEIVIAGVRISSPSRVVYPALGITKLDVARYYEWVADWILPHVVGRPLTLVRCPKSVGAMAAHGRLAESCVYMRHAKVWGPEPLRRVRIQEKTKVGEYLVCDTLPALIGLAQMDVLEIHTWNSTVDHLEKPNRVVFDLDPDPTVDRARVSAAAKILRDLLARLDLESWVKTTGGKGLHVVVPLTPGAGWDECLQFSRAVASAIARRAPDEFTVRVEKSHREGKILIDYLRNNRGNTSVAAYSTRARPTATVSAPLRWSEVDAVAPDAFDIRTIRKRLARLRADPWRDYFRARQTLRASMLRHLG